MFAKILTLTMESRSARRAFICCIVLLAPLRGIGQTPADSGRASFFQLQFADALASFQRAVTSDPSDTQSRAWLAETLRRLGKAEDAVRVARDVLRTGSCSSLAHCVIAQSAGATADTVRLHARAAIACDPSDPNPWLMLWGEGMKQNDPALHDSAIHMMRATGFFTPAALAWGRAQLRTLPPGTVLITSGDMDTYPALAVQITEGFRTDVTVLEHEHAGIDWARRFYSQWKHVSFPGADALPAGKGETTADRPGTPASDEQVIHGMLDAHRRGEESRPIALSLTVDTAFLASERNEFQLSGTYLLYVPGRQGALPDTTALRACLEAIVPEEFRGSWTSSRDRSPIRRYYTDGLAEIFVELYATYTRELTRAGRNTEANEVRLRADAFVRATTTSRK